MARDAIDGEKEQESREPAGTNEKRNWFTGQGDTQAFYWPNRRTKFLHIILPSIWGGNDDRGWRKITNFVFGWALSVPLFLLSCLWERTVRRKHWLANHGRSARVSGFE